MTPDLSCLRPGDTAIDIGAHLGTWTGRLAEAVGPTGTVLAVEPHPVTAARLRVAMADRPQVQVIEACVGERMDDQAQFYSDEGDTRRSTLWMANRLKDGPTYPVRMVTLDSLVTSLPQPPRFIKVDAQGAEAAILRGAVQTLTLPVRWFVEVWQTGLGHAGATVQDVLEPFRRAGYTPQVTKGVTPWDRVRVYAEQQGGHSAIDVLMVPA